MLYDIVISLHLLTLFFILHDSKILFVILFVSRNLSYFFLILFVNYKGCANIMTDLNNVSKAVAQFKKNIESSEQAEQSASLLADLMVLYSVINIIACYFQFSIITTILYSITNSKARIRNCKYIKILLYIYIEEAYETALLYDVITNNKQVDRHFALLNSIYLIYPQLRSLFHIGLHLLYLLSENRLADFHTCV